MTYRPFLLLAALPLVGCAAGASARPAARTVPVDEITAAEAEPGDGWQAMANQCEVTLSDFYLLTGIDPAETLHPRMRVLCPAPAPATTTTTSTEVTTSTAPETTVAPTTTESAPSTTVPSPTTTAPTTTTTSTTTTTTTTLAPTTTAAPTTTTQPPDPTGTFEEHFTNTDRAYFDSRFDVEIKDLTNDHSGYPHDYSGDHNAACEAPTTSRTVHNLSLDQVWLCAPGGPQTGHVMSSAGSADYSYTIFSPKGSLTGRKICWDVNLTTSGGGRTWWEVTVLPADFYAANPTFAYSNLIFPGEPKFPSVAVTFDFSENKVHLWEGTTKHYGQWPWEGGTGEALFPEVSDKGTRYTHCMEDTPSGLAISQERPVSPDNPDGSWDGFVPGLHLPAEYVVGFKAENYNAGKDGSANQTWHWDDIVITS